MLNLANIFDTDPNTLSLYSLIGNGVIDRTKKREMKDKLKPKNRIINKLKSRRNNYTAHKNIGYTLDLRLISKDFPLKY